MSHIRYEQWLAYINNNLDEETCTSYEAHLYDCDECLEAYMKVIETIDMKEPAVLTDEIMKQVYPSENKLPDKENGHKKTLLHYSVAAAMTFLLMSTGVFTQMTHFVGDVEENEKKSTSFVMELLDSPFSMIDKFKERE